MKTFIKTTCEACGRFWLGMFWDKPLCNECYAEKLADEQSRWGEPIQTEHEAYINAHE